MASTAGLTVTEKTALKVDPQSLLEQAITSNAGVETLERLFSLAKDFRGEQAKQAWNHAIVEFQKLCPKITKGEEAHIATKGGRFSYKYASLDGIMTVIVPIMTKLDLSISWRHTVASKQVTANCRISHGMGHFEESGEVAMPIGEDASGANAAQKVGIALTYAKRYSLLSIVGIAPEDDPDAQGTDTTKSEPSDADEDSRDHEPFPHGEERDAPEVISESQHKRMWAMAFSFAKKEGMDQEWAKTKLINLCRDKGFGNTKQVTVDKYKAICSQFEVLPF